MVLKVIPNGAKNSKSVKWWARLLRSKNEAFRLKKIFYLSQVPPLEMKIKLNVGAFNAH